MSQSASNLPRFVSSGQVVTRFVMRLVLLGGFAVVSGQAFGSMLSYTLALTAIFCAVTALLRQEYVFAPVLTHWDESAGYVLLHALLLHLA
jgi:hypothetical protein